MRAVSLFSGVCGIDLAFERAGIETVLQAEKDPWCLEVLARHWPDVERVDDVRAVGVGHGAGDECGEQAEPGAGTGADAQWSGADVDLVYGGFPCQPFSVAGKRGGADDGRNGWPEFRRIVSELRPRWVVAENVPGLLSIDSGRYFATIINDLDELGFDVAWAVLDAQHFGVPQRRRRVFIVAGPRGRGAEQVLSICEGCGGNPETGGEAGEGTPLAPALRASGVGTERIGDTRGQDPLVVEPAMVVAHTLTAETYHHGGFPNQTVGPDNGYMQATAAGVRRLTPRECNRLQGFPDDWDRWTADGREIADSHRYRMMGNAVAVPVLEWIGRRLVAVDALT